MNRSSRTRRLRLSSMLRCRGAVLCVWWNRCWTFDGCFRGGLQHVDELVEEEFGVFGSAAGFGVELGGEEGQCLVAYAFVGAVVHVDEEGFPVGRECG